MAITSATTASRGRGPTRTPRRRSATITGTGPVGGPLPFTSRGNPGRDSTTVSSSRAPTAPGTSSLLIGSLNPRASYPPRAAAGAADRGPSEGGAYVGDATCRRRSDDGWRTVRTARRHGSADTALHLQLDEARPLDRVLHGQRAGHGLDEPVHDHAHGLLLGEAPA